MNRRYFFQKGSIPVKKLRNAVSKIAPGKVTEEDVVFLIDCTIAGNGKEGLIFTGDAMYWSARSSGAGSVSYSELDEVILNRDYDLWVNSRKVPVSYPVRKETGHLLKAIIEKLRGEYEEPAGEGMSVERYHLTPSAREKKSTGRPSGDSGSILGESFSPDLLKMVMENRITELSNDFTRTNRYPFFQKGHIRRKELRNAVSKIARGEIPEKDVMFYFDQTIFSSGKYGMIFTWDRLYWTDERASGCRRYADMGRIVLDGENILRIGTGIDGKTQRMDTGNDKKTQRMNTGNDEKTQRIGTGNDEKTQRIGTGNDEKTPVIDSKGIRFRTDRRNLEQLRSLLECLGNDWKSIEADIVKAAAAHIRDDTGDVNGKDIRILRETENIRGYIRLKVAVENNSGSVITDVCVDIIFDGDMFHLDSISPSYELEGNRAWISNIGIGEKRTVAFYLDPCICATSVINAFVTYRDHEGILHTVPMMDKKVNVVCPIFFTGEIANTAMVRNLVANVLEHRDSKMFTIPDGMDPARAFEIAKSAVGGRSIQSVREYRRPGSPYRAETWYYGVTKVKKIQTVIRASVDGEKNSIQLFAATSCEEALTGLLAELGNDLLRSLRKRGKGTDRITNITIRDSVLHRTSLLFGDPDDGDDGNEDRGKLNVHIEDSVVHRTKIGTGDQDDVTGDMETGIPAGNSCPLCGKKGDYSGDHDDYYCPGCDEYFGNM